MRSTVRAVRASLVLCASFVAGVVACVGDEPAIETKETPSDAGAGSDVITTVDDAAAEARCEKTLCGTACVDTTSDPAHCGACGHDCGGGTCASSTCQPTVIAKDIDEPVSLTVNPNAVVWLRQGAVESCPIGACTKPKMITAEAETFPGNITDKVSGSLVATTASDVFWIGGSSPGTTARLVYKCPLSGCIAGLPKTFHDPGSGEQPGQIVTSGTDVFVTFKFLGIDKCDGTKDSCGTPSRIDGTGGDQVFGLAVDTQRVYWTVTFGASPGNGGGAFACGRGGCGGAPTTLSDPGWSLAAHAGTVFVNAYGTIGSCLGAGCAATPTELATKQEANAPIAADGTGVYWIERGNAAADAGPPSGRILMCALPGCAGGPKVLATGQAAPRSIATLDGFVYWANRGTGAAKSGSIVRVRK